MVWSDFLPEDQLSGDSEEEEEDEDERGDQVIDKPQRESNTSSSLSYFNKPCELKSYTETATLKHRLRDVKFCFFNERLIDNNLCLSQLFLLPLIWQTY